MFKSAILQVVGFALFLGVFSIPVLNQVDSIGTSVGSILDSRGLGNIPVHGDLLQRDSTTDASVDHVTYGADEPFDIPFPLGPVTFHLNGSIEPAKREIDAALSVGVLVFWSFTLGEVKGDLKTGVIIDLGVEGFLSGEANFYEKNNSLWVDLKHKVLDKTFGPASIELPIKI